MRLGIFVCVVGVAAGLIGCEFRPTNQWVPDVQPAPAVAAIAEPGTAEQWIQPEIWWVWDTQQGHPVGVAVPLGGGRFWVPWNGPMPREPVVGKELATVQPVTTDSTQETGAIVSLILDGPEPSMPTVELRAVHDVVQRVTADDGLIVSERLDVIGRSPWVTLVSCPQSGSGAVFDRAGNWVKAVWLPGADGGCPVLRPLDLNPDG